MKGNIRFISGVAVIATSSLGVALPASAATPLITVNGASLADAQLTGTSFTALVAAPADTEDVTFVLDGVYLGKDATAPYSFDIATTAGEHKLKARVETEDDKTSETVRFTVNNSGSTPVPTPPVVIPPVEPPVVVPPTPTPTPNPTPTAPSSSITVDTAAELTSALASADPGTEIVLEDGIYTGAFEASGSGTESQPISLVGSSGAVLTTGSLSKGYGLHITGDYWNVKGISVTKSSKGIMLDDSDGTVLDGVDVGFIGDEAVHFRKGSSNSSIINSAVHDTGLDTPDYGEGVYIGSANSNWQSVMGSKTTADESNNVLVKNNRIYNTTTEGVDVKEGTTGGIITGNVFTNSGYSGIHYGDSWVDVKGNDYNVFGNSGNGTKLDAFQVHKTITGWGNDNSFSENNVVGGVPGYLVNVQKGLTGNSVACQETAAALGVSNISCA